MAKEISIGEEMLYPKDPYYLNTALKNKKKNQEEIFDENFYNLAKILKGKTVYEVGFEFGQRLKYLEENDVNVLGGVEFNPIFGLYSKHSDLFGQKSNGKWEIRFIELDYWEPTKKDVVFTNHFLDSFSPKDYEILLEKLLKSSKELYMNENIDLNFPKQEGVYVVINESGDDIEVDSKSSPELPNFEPLRNRLNRKE